MSKIGNGVLNADTTGVIIGSQVNVSGFLGIASADACDCVITDSTGTIVYQCKSALAGERYFPMSLPHAMPLEQLNVTTFTNMTRVIIYL